MNKIFRIRWPVQRSFVPSVLQTFKTSVSRSANLTDFFSQTLIILVTLLTSDFISFTDEVELEIKSLASAPKLISPLTVQLIELKTPDE